MIRAKLQFLKQDKSEGLFSAQYGRSNREVAKSSFARTLACVFTRRWNVSRTYVLREKYRCFGGVESEAGKLSRNYTILRTFSVWKA